MPVNIIDTLKPKNNGSFPVVEAADVAVSEELRLPEALAAKADASALATTNAVVDTKANSSDVSTATAFLQEQIDQIEISASAEAVVAPEVAAARVDANGVSHVTLKDRIDDDYDKIETLINGSTVSVSTHYDSSFSAQTSTNIYKSNRIIIPANSIIEKIKFYVKIIPTEGAFNCFYILNADNKILDKFEFSPTETGWSELTVNKSYNEEVYLAVTRGGIGISYSTTSKTDYYSNGLFESSQTEYDIGQTLSFTQNVPERYYEFGIEIIYIVEGLNERISSIRADLTAASESIDECEDDIDALNTQINQGTSSTTKYYWSQGATGAGNAIYKSSQGAIATNFYINNVKFRAGNNPSSAIIFFVTSEGVILDKFEVEEPVSGWNTVSINKKYNETAYIAISGGAIQNTYSENEKTVYFSDGLYEGSSSDRNKTIGETISFSHNVPSRYYGFDIEVDTSSKSIVESISDIEDEIANIDVGAFTFDISGNIMPKVTKTGETGYSLLGRWYSFGADYPQCCNSGGSSVMFKVKNATTVSIDIEQVVHPSHPDWVMSVEPYIAYSIDGSSFTRSQIGSGAISISIPSADEHFIWIVVDGMCLNSGSANRNSGWSAICLNSITSDGDMYKVEIKSKQILFVGDSIVEGINTLGTTSTSESNSQINEFTFRTARKLNSYPLVQGYGGSTAASGINKEKYSIVDTSSDTFISMMSPDIIVIEYGYNDYNAGQTSEQFTNYYNELIDLLSWHYPGVPILCLIPFKQSFASEIRSIAAARSYCYCIETSSYNVSYSDNAHPNAEGAEEIAKRLSADIASIMSKEFFI